MGDGVTEDKESMWKNGVFVHIIESPSPDDLLADRREGTLLMAGLQLARIRCTYNLVANRETLRVALTKRLRKAMETHSRFPILHFSGHGNQGGIGLTDGSSVPWSELHERFLKINKAVDDSLIVCLSSCQALGACTMAMTEGGPLPFLALVAHQGEPRWDDAGVAFLTFYHRLFKGGKVRAALEAMKVASGDDGFEVRLASKVRQDWLQRSRASDLKVLVRQLREALER